MQLNITGRLEEEINRLMQPEIWGGYVPDVNDLLLAILAERVPVLLKKPGTRGSYRAFPDGTGTVAQTRRAWGW